jgi:carbon monoxide dehydrogenase subunit G
MQMQGEQRIAAPRERVWAALNDPEVLRACLPGCQSLEKVADDRFDAVAEVRIGPIGARFKGVVTLAELDPPNGYTITGHGEAGIAGNAKGAATVRLSDAPGGTLVAYAVDAQVGGRMAQLGGGVIDATARQVAGRFFSRFAEIVEAGSTPAAPPRVGAAAQPAAAAAAAPNMRPASGGVPVGWILAVATAALAGFLLGRGAGGGGSDWLGLAVGLLLIVVAAAAFEQGRRAAAPVLMLDAGSLRRLLDGGGE